MNNNQNRGGSYNMPPNGPRQNPNMQRPQPAQNPRMGQNPNAGQNPRAGQPYAQNMQNPQSRNEQARPAQNPHGQNAQNTRARAPQQNTPMSRIGQQTPARRRSEPKKVKLTAEQMEINRINRQRERYYIKKRRTQMVKTFFSRFLLFLVTTAILAGFLASALFLTLTRTESTNSSSWSYVIGDDKYSLAHAKVVREGRVYVSFTDIAELCDLAITGSWEDMRFVIKGDEDETIRFVTDSRTVYVNDVETRLSGECFREKDDLFVPVDFVRAYFKGLNVELDERSHDVKVTRIITNLNENGNLPRGEEPVYGELSFLLQSASPIESINEEDAIWATMPDLGFVTNLMPYEKYMNPGNTTEYLTLVNVDHKLPAEYAPQDLMTVSSTRDDGREMQLLREPAAMALEAMFKELRAAGFEDVSVTSAYRSYSYQEYIFNQYLAQNNNDYAFVSTFSNPPGSSEHQTGLALDMHNLPAASKEFGNSDAFRWLRDNCWKFGFILRYPADKMDVTKIDYEPWHYRYVGRFHAQRMKELGMCLEEYTEHLENSNR